MKKNYAKLYNKSGILKVVSLSVGAIYLVFWFYSFFKLPLWNVFAPLFNFFVIPVKFIFDTERTFNGADIEMAYFIMGIVLAIISFVFAKLEKYALEMAKREEIKELKQRKLMEEQLNRELERENLNNILHFKYFSTAIRLKIEYKNEILAQTSVGLDEILKNSYEEIKGLILGAMPDLTFQNMENGIFISGLWPNNRFDFLIDTVLNSIKAVKNNNAIKNVKTNFAIVSDAQKSKQESVLSFDILSSILNAGYYGKAVITLPFKNRFDLIQSKSKYTTEALGLSVFNFGFGEEEIFILKSKPKEF